MSKNSDINLSPEEYPPLYSNSEITNYSQVPCQVDKHLDVIHFWKNGGFFLGASNLTGRYWMGSVWYYNDAKKAPYVEQCVTGRELEAGICDGITLDNNIAVVGLDTGGVEVMQLSQDESPGSLLFTTKAYSCEHDDSVNSITANTDGKKVVSGGAEGCIKVWDLESYVAVNTYRYAHTDIIWTVAYHHSDPDVFASCSQDGRTLVWDSRVPRPAMLVETGQSDTQPMAVAWNPDHSNTLAVGDSIGQLILRDIRSPVETTSTISLHQRQIHRISFSPKSPSLLATCADESQLKVVDCSGTNIRVIYENDDHSDYIRGLAWKPNSSLLFSCGWDKMVIEHDVPQSLTAD